MHICFADILLPQFLTGIFFNALLFGVGRLHIRFGTLDAHVRADCWHLWVGECIWCLGHDGCLTAIDVDCTKVPLRLLHSPRKLVQGSQPKVEDVAFQVTAPALEVSLGFGI